MHSIRIAGLILLSITSVGFAAAQQADPVAAGLNDQALTDAAQYPPLPRYREGGTPYDPAQSLYPYAVHAEAAKDMPNTGLMASPPEYSPARGVLFYYVSSQWPTVVRDCVVALTHDPAFDDIAYVVVPNVTQQNSATSLFSAGGADMSKVVFIQSAGNALWLRDYGPHFVWQDDCLGIADSHYYPTRPLDNFQPTVLGDDFLGVRTYDMPLYYSGGNFQPGPNRSGFCTALIRVDNPVVEGFSDAFYAELFQHYQGIDTLNIMPQLPFSVDGTGHIDMWMYLVDEDTVIISEFKPGSNATAISITNNAVPYMQGLGFTVYRTPAWNDTAATHYTYTNAFRVNDRILIPTYGQGDASYLDEDAAALATWQAAAGAGVEIIPINCYDIIPAAGAIHCIVMQVPRYVGAAPSACVLSPRGGELLVCGTTHEIRWTASDTDNDAIPTIDLYYSVDGGTQWTHIATTANTGRYVWNVPTLPAPQVLVKVVATSADLDQGEGVSAAPFQIAGATRHVYDFATGAGVERRGWGYQTTAWSAVNNVRLPVNTAITAADYLRLATSNATGGDTDTNRMISPAIGANNESTYVFEFTLAELPANIDDLAVLWEGYADNCTQAELYVWDVAAGQWGDGLGLLGQNRFIDNWAGNRDGTLETELRADLADYIDGTGKLTFLLYAERKADETFHDYMSVTVATIYQTLLGDMNCDGVVDFGDINPFVDSLVDPALYETSHPDCYILNGDINQGGTTGFEDINPFVDLLL